MGKKGNKRPLEGAEAPVKLALNGKQPAKKLKVTNEAVPNGLPQKTAKNPKKLKNEAPKPRIIESVQLDTKKAIKVKNQTQEPKAKKAEVKKEKVEVKKDKTEVKKENGVVKKEKVDQKKKVSKDVSEKKLAALEKKKELRKQNRLENGQYRPENLKLTEEQVKKRIEEISSRGTPSRTARRRLATLKKKLRILQGTYTVQAPVKKMSSSTKRKIRRHKNAVMRAEKMKGIEGVTDGDQQKKVEEKAKNVAELVKQERNKKGEAGSKGEKKGGKEAVKVEMKDEDDEDEEDDDDEEEDEESEEEEEGENSELNSSAEAASLDDDDDDDEDDDDENEEEDEDEEEDDDDDDDEESEEEEEKAPQPPKKVQKLGNVKPEKKEKPVQQQKQVQEKSERTVYQQKPAHEKKSRYVLFVGNLPYTASQDDIKKHFLTKVSEVCSVRIPADPKTNNPRGFAYVEFTNNIDYEKGLSLHESELQGRRINVQYSTSGSKSSGKKPNVVAKNQKLHALRKQGKLAGSVKDSNKRNFRRNKQNRQGV